MVYPTDAQRAAAFRLVAGQRRKCRATWTAHENGTATIRAEWGQTVVASRVVDPDGRVIPQEGDQVTVTDLALGAIWTGTIVDTERFGDRYVVVEDSDGHQWRVGRSFVSAQETCPDCGRPVRWDDQAGDYRHVDPARSCFLHPRQGR